MKKIVGVFLTGIALCLSYQASAQGFVDNALNFSRVRPLGSARIQGIGGAQISLGGDYSSIMGNPAGLGMYNRSEITFSPGLNFYNSSSTYLNNSEEDSKTIFNIPGLSGVYHLENRNKDSDFSGSIGVSLTRVNDFNNVFQYSGVNSRTSIIDHFLDDATGIDVDNLNYDFPTGLAFDNYLLQDSAFLKDSPNGGDYSEYFSLLGTFPDDPDDIRTVTRSENVTIKGTQYQWSIGAGANYKDRIFFGASIGLTTLRYKFKRTYRESDFHFELDPDYKPLDYLQMTEDIDIKGSGLNLTLGVIARPVDFFQVGISLATPTWWNQITDSYTAGVSTKWNNWDYFGTGTLTSYDYTSESPTVSDYALTTPMKFSTGLTFFLGKYGFVSGDIEWVNYAKTRYSSQIDQADFSSDNNEIKAIYKDVVNYRMGVELRYQIFRLRGGYNVQSNPMITDLDQDRSIKTVSGGAGVRFDKFYIDFALSQSKSNYTYSPYLFLDGSGPQVDLKNKLVSSVFTVGFSL